MFVKTSKLTGAQLDYAVAICSGRSEPEVVNNFHLAWYTWGNTHYSTNWAHGGPIIARHVDCIRKRSKAEEADLVYPNQNFKFKAEIFADIDGYYCGHGPTPLVAAMRCYVASKLGDEVDIPNNLCRT